MRRATHAHAPAPTPTPAENQTRQTLTLHRLRSEDGADAVLGKLVNTGAKGGGVKSTPWSVVCEGIEGKPSSYELKKAQQFAKGPMRQKGERTHRHPAPPQLDSQERFRARLLWFQSRGCILSPRTQRCEHTHLNAKLRIFD